MLESETYSSLETLKLRLRVTNITIHCKTLHNPTLVVCYSLNIKISLFLPYLHHFCMDFVEQNQQMFCKNTFNMMYMAYQKVQFIIISNPDITNSSWKF